MNKILITSLLIFSSTLLIGCNNRSSVMPNQPTVPDEAEINSPTVVLPTSQGNINEDLEQIDKTLDSLNTDVDFPSVSESELTAE